MCTTPTDNNENSKIKEQYNREKANEEKINKEITVIMKNCASQKDLMDFTKKIREYRTRIYELKMQLKEDLIKAYSMKESKEFDQFDIEKTIQIDQETARRYILREYYIVSKETQNFRQYDALRETEEKSCEKNVRRICEEINIILATRIFKYYEKEIAFWEERNLKKIMEVDSKERFYD